MELGVQFYTLRDQCKTLSEFSESLKRVADIGYRTVQISGVCTYEPQWLKEQLAVNGLRCVITHKPIDDIADATQRLMDEHRIYGCPHIGIGAGPELLKGEDNMQWMLDVAHTAGRVLHDNGFQLMYHHHSPEFTRDCPNEMTRLEYLAANTTAEELGFTLDTYWVQAGGASFSELAQRLSGRIPCVHLKDRVMDEWEQHMAPVGSGNLDWEAILSVLETTGTDYALVEQDLTYDENPFACLKKSYDYLTALGLK